MEVTKRERRNYFVDESDIIHTDVSGSNRAIILMDRAGNAMTLFMHPLTFDYLRHKLNRTAKSIRMKERYRNHGTQKNKNQ